jgi:hypothetical protein
MRGSPPVEAPLASTVPRAFTHARRLNGEVADAFLGVHGLNRRKGTCRTQDDLLAELADVIITAAVAMCGVTEDVDGACRFLEARVAAVIERAGC